MTKRKHPEAQAGARRGAVRRLDLVAGLLVALLAVQLLVLVAGPVQPHSFIPAALAVPLLPLALMLRRKAGPSPAPAPDPDGITLAATAHGMSGLGPLGRSGAILAASAHGNRAERD